MNTVKTNINIRDGSPRHATSHKNVTVRTVPVGRSGKKAKQRTRKIYTYCELV